MIFNFILSLYKKFLGLISCSLCDKNTMVKMTDMVVNSNQTIINYVHETSTARVNRIMLALYYAL